MDVSKGTFGVGVSVLGRTTDSYLSPVTGCRGAALIASPALQLSSSFPYTLQDEWYRAEALSAWPAGSRGLLGHAELRRDDATCKVPDKYYTDITS